MISLRLFRSIHTDLIQWTYFDRKQTLKFSSKIYTVWFVVYSIVSYNSIYNVLLVISIYNHKQSQFFPFTNID